MVTVPSCRARIPREWEKGLCRLLPGLQPVMPPELWLRPTALSPQVGVFSPSHRNHYLNVTPNNLLKIYPPEPEGSFSQPSPAQREVREGTVPVALEAQACWDSPRGCYQGVCTPRATREEGGGLGETEKSSRGPPMIHLCWVLQVPAQIGLLRDHPAQPPRGPAAPGDWGRWKMGSHSTEQSPRGFSLHPLSSGPEREELVGAAGCDTGELELLWVGGKAQCPVENSSWGWAASPPLCSAEGGLSHRIPGTWSRFLLWTQVKLTRVVLPLPVQMTWTGSWESCLRISSPPRPKLIAADLGELWHGQGEGYCWPGLGWTMATAGPVRAAPWPGEDAERAGDALAARLLLSLLCLFWSRELGGPGESRGDTASMPVPTPAGRPAPLGSQTCIKGLFCPCLAPSARVSPSPLTLQPVVPLCPPSAELQRPEPFPWGVPCSPSLPQAQSVVTPRGLTQPQPEPCGVWGYPVPWDRPHLPPTNRLTSLAAPCQSDPVYHLGGVIYRAAWPGLLIQHLCVGHSPIYNPHPGAGGSLLTPPASPCPLGVPMAQETFTFTSSALRSLRLQQELLEQEDRRRALARESATRRLLPESPRPPLTPSRRLQYCRDPAVHNALYTGDLVRIKSIFKDEITANLVMEMVSEELVWSPEQGMGLGGLRGAAGSLHCWAPHEIAGGARARGDDWGCSSLGAGRWKRAGFSNLRE